MANERNAGSRAERADGEAMGAVKDVVLDGLMKAGGAAYLAQVAESDPKTFCALLTKILPMQVTGEGGGPVRVDFATVYEPKPGRAD